MKDNDEKNIKATLIFEVLGRPPEHLTSTLNEILEKVNGEKGVEIKEKKINEPVLMKDQKEFFTSFAEIELHTDEIMDLMMIIFKYMPAYMEIISPESISLKNSGLNEIFGELIGKLHGYDEIARIVQTEKMILEKKLKDLMEKSNIKDDKIE